MTRIVFERGTMLDKTWLSRIAGKYDIIDGAYNPFTDRIRVWCDDLSEDEIRKVIRHELQHAHDRRMLLAFRFFCWADMVLCGIFMGQLLKFGNPFPHVIYVCVASFLWFVAATVHDWFEERAKRAAENESPAPKRSSTLNQCPQCSSQFKPYKYLITRCD